MRADIKRAKKLFHNFANAPIAAITTLQNANSFVFIKNVIVKKVVIKYQKNIWQMKDSSCGIFTGFFFVGGLFAISHFEQIYSAKFDKYFMVIFVIKEII